MPPRKTARNGNSNVSKQNADDRSMACQLNSSGTLYSCGPMGSGNGRGGSYELTAIPSSYMSGDIGELMAPKHAHLPFIPGENEMSYYLLITLIAYSATAMQYLHLYRTAWWLPQSHAKYAVNFHLIDMHLVGFLGAMEVIPLMLFFFKRLFMGNRKRFWFLIMLLGFMGLTALWLLCFVFFSVHVYRHTSNFYLILLVYPFFTYAVVYYGHVPSLLLEHMAKRLWCFFKTLRHNWFTHSISSTHASSSINANYPSNDNYNNNMIHSSCSSSHPSSPSSRSSSRPILSASASPSRSFSPVEASNGLVKEDLLNTTSINSNISNTFVRSDEKMFPVENEETMTGHSTRPTVADSKIFKFFQASARIHSGSVKTSYLGKNFQKSLPIHHNCTNNPEKVREEAEILKADFNHRSRDILFTTLFITFHSTVVPILFVSTTGQDCEHIWNSIHYDGPWCTQHLCLTALCTFLTAAIHYLPPTYIDLMHRCALHLGKWCREENRVPHAPSMAWSELQLFPQGTLVKHVRGLFRSVGFLNAAEPGNSMHARFHMLFYRPLFVINFLCGAVSCALGLQFFLLAYSYEWYKLISISLMMFFNFASLYKLLRNRILLGRCYKEESNHMNHPHHD